MRRRKFLYSTAITLATAALPVNDSWALIGLLLPPAPNDPIRSMILADVEARRLRENPAQAQSVTALPIIYARIRVSGEAPNEAEIKQMLDNRGALHRSSAVAMPEYFLKLEDPNRYTEFGKYFGQAAAISGGLLLALASTPALLAAGLTLSVFAVVSDDVWKLSGNIARGLNLAPDPGEKDRLTRAILDAGAKAFEDRPAFKGVVDSPLLREKVGINFNKTRDALIAELPEQLRNVVNQAIKEASRDLRVDVTLQQQAFSNVIDQFSVQLDQFDKQLKQYGEILRRQEEREAREAARARIAALQNDVNAGISIATFVLGRAMGDRQKANEIGQVLSGLANIGFAIATENWLGAISLGLGLLDGVGNNPMAPVMDMLEELGKKLDQLRTEMHERFDRLEQQQQEMVIALGRIYSAVREGTAITGERINQLKDSFEHYWLTTNDDDRRRSTDLVINTLSAGERLRDAAKPGWESLYLNNFVVFLHYARGESRASYYRGALGSGPGHITSEVRARKQADRLIGLVPSVCAMASVNLRADLVNPFALDLGAEAYMRADLLLESIPNSTRKTDLLNLWNDALAVRTALNTVSSKKVIGKLVANCAGESGVSVAPSNASPNTLLGTLRLMCEGWSRETMKPHLTVDTVQRKLFDSPLPEVMYSFLGSQYRVKDDPFDSAIALRLIELREISKKREFFGLSGFVETTIYDIKVNEGPDSGNHASYSQWMYLDKPPAEVRDFEWWGGVTRSFLDYCEYLVGYHYATTVLPSFPRWLHEHGFELSVSNWSDTASALRLAATIGQWRRIDGPEIEGQTDVRNISFLSTTEEVLDFLARTIQTRVETLTLEARIRAVQRASAQMTGETLKLKPSTYRGSDDPRFMNVLFDLHNRISRDLKNITDAPVMPNDRSVPVIDRLLRRLAGYMTVNDITFPLPSISDPSKAEILRSPRGRTLRAPKRRVLRP